MGLDRAVKSDVSPEESKKRSASRYIGAQFADDFVVFENVNYGNALWGLFENWAETSKRSRIDLLRLRDVPYARIVHSEGWQERLADFVETEKKKRGISDPRSTRRA